MSPKEEPFSESPSSSGISPLSENTVAFAGSPMLDMEVLSASNTETTPIKVDPDGQNAVFEGGSGSNVPVAEPELPRPLECLQGSLIPPFLSKTYDLVDEASLDPIISWGETGESFVVWDPLEFARVVLPRSFKHNNFSSFVRQLNTYGFRKIDTDKWEFANKAFRRGQKQLLKTIQRRRSTQSQQVGSYIGSLTEAGKSGLESEIERLKKEKNVLMQEVVELQQEQRGTVHYMEAVNERLQDAEKRQKQMVSFLAKLLQNPAFVAGLQEKRDQSEIESSRPKRKFIKQIQHATAIPESPVKGQMVEYEPDWRNLAVSSGNPDSDPVPLEGSPDYLLEGIIGTEFTGEDLTLHTKNVTSGELALSADLPVTLGIFEQVGEGPSVPGTEDPLCKGKNVVSPQHEFSQGYCLSFPEELTKERNYPEFLSPGTEGVRKQEDMWNMSFDVTSGMPSSSSHLWGDIPSYDIPELGATAGMDIPELGATVGMDITELGATVGMSDVWDFSSLQGTGVLGTDQWPAESSNSDQSKIQAGQSRDISKNTSP